MNKKNEHIVTDQEVLVRVEGVSKKFAKSLKRSLLYGVQDVLYGISRKAQDKSLRKDEFWAVNHVSFELRRGECLGLIGHNGAGKSTLLKILNGLINPDTGTVTIKGRVGALIELGAGFNPILTGRENIYNNGAILGLTREEINAKVEAIIDFAEIREFIDMPVQHYSSGMKVRLGFAVAAQLEPDVLIIDEVLAVGDMGFIMKCFKTIDNLLSSTAIIYVSHNMPTVSRLCNHIILMDKGKSIFYGDNVGKAIDLYYSSFTDNISHVVYSNNSIEFISAEIDKARKDIDGTPQLDWLDDFLLHLKFKIADGNEPPLFRILIYDKEQRPLSIFEPNYDSNLLTVKNNLLDFKVQHKKIQLSKGLYSINITAFKRNTNEPILRVNNIITFQVLHEEDHFQPFLLSANFLN
ncbi:ABC transporter ATP-binding protein [Aestuariibaculum sp. YM273]|uniref:ABC transporter ATP-binding protein n=1 Tax=Aestuariibaculum sp. YM273 TaxID=3070659 RepID=UPI0027DBE995|nr:ABC transporter ATP-binding protein [Aestuariibaculum sp. YM273]WMI65835.1 ABC transporter ATP-binding protein [Aestuariibaculum sp. YM273]